uniref:ZN622/Rei1/Reh1 zinc finger C2H2-type domain-containing protein n=1 Tax=Corethron hystrix TaxID=216773 RepID=A0A7S1BI44_9STRA|mmetsp:Transcript_27390/g.62892  ORF Transcript_27390/g.62892 Transcript_27390/m.62892 type:complete len:508 (+) Transcript_27390:375-1898(+)
MAMTGTPTVLPTHIQKEQEQEQNDVPQSSFDATNNIDAALTSTTAPGETFFNRAALAEHYRSDYHKYNLRRRSAGLPCLQRQDFEARLAAALALRAEKEDKRDGTAHLKNRSFAPSASASRRNKKSGKFDRAAAKHERKRMEREQQPTTQNLPDKDDASVEQGTLGTAMAALSTSDAPSPVPDNDIAIDPRRCLFTLKKSATVAANLQRMQSKFGFFLPDAEHCVDVAGLIGYCHEKIRLGHICLYSQRVFRSAGACVKHMIAKGRTKIRYEEGIDLHEFEPFYDFSVVNAEFLESKGRHVSSEQTKDSEIFVSEGDNEDDDDDDADDDDTSIVWKDISDDEESDHDDDSDSDVDSENDKDDLADYRTAVLSHGFNISPLGELIFPNGKVVGHRGLVRYYRQRFAPVSDRAALVAVRGETQVQMPNMRGGVRGLLQTPRGGNGVLVSAKGGGFTSLSLYRYKAVMKKAARQESAGYRKFNKHHNNINRMDKKANRLMNGVSVAHAKR